MASSSSCSNSERSYHVFMSFRGPDVRNTFLGHLYTALDQAGIYTYIDSEELRKGEQITPELTKAIDDSRIAVIIFSKDYASSSWCLEELTKIMECRKQKGLIVLPVFYKVEPHEVRTPRESYRKAMAKHEVKFGKDSEKVKRWKKALFDASFLSGWHFTDGFEIFSLVRYEAGLIQEIVLEISTQLAQTPLDVPKYSVGMDSRVQELKTILNLQSKDDILMVGLLGQGGVGKTTLAKAIYNAVFREFEGSCFLERVRENFKESNDLVPLQKKLLLEILPGKKLKVYSASVGSSLIRERLCNKKVLIILDDVDDAHQLNALAGDCEWFGKGSRIIITTRNKHLLISHRVNLNHMYEVKALKDGEALELFRRHAFQRNQQVKIRSDLVASVSRYTGGLPLALEVLGSFLCGRAEEEWEETLKKLAKRPNQKINGVLRVSYDGLEGDEKDIFLDIACFFKGESTEYIKEVLNSCDFYTTIGLRVLIERSLISEENKTLQMHDLLQSMAMDIVKEECRDDPGKRSRLWLQDDILRVLSGDMGTNAVKAIVLKLPKPTEMYIGHDAFANMRMLRLLILRNVDNPFTGPIDLPNELRWFEWPHCASIPEFSDGPKKLVGLDMRNSKIEARLEQFKGLENIKFINLSECQSLVCMPDLSCTPNLEKLNLRGCQNLEHAHESVGYHRKLQLLDLKGCCKFRRFPDIPDKNKSLREVILNGTSIEELPASIENLISLKHLYLENCKKLAILPSSIYRLQNLSSLMLGGCSKLIKFPKEEEEEDLSDTHMKIGFPKLHKLFLGKCNLSEVEFLENLSCFPLLQVLELSGNNFTHLPACEQLHHLHVLAVSSCQQLQEISKIPEKLKHLLALGCKSLSRVPSNMLDVNLVTIFSSQELFSNGLSVNHLFKLENIFCKGLGDVILPGGEMPKWLLPTKEGYMSFVASKDLYKRFLGVAFCVVFRAKEKRSISFKIAAYANGRRGKAHDEEFDSDVINLSNSDHMWLNCIKAKDLWREDDFGPNDSIHFHFSIRVSGGCRVTVKKCGFRLICKSLDNDLEVLFQDDQLLDPALLYEVGCEDSQMTLWEESPRETEYWQDCQTSNEEDSSSELVHNSADFSIEKHRYSEIDPHHRSVHPGGEMPKDFVLVEDDTISFMASQDLYDKFQGLSLCVAFGVEDEEKEVSFDIVPQFQGQRQNVLSGTLGSFDSDHVWIQSLEPNLLWGLLEGEVDFGQFEESYLRFSLTVRVLGGTMKKLGYLLKCKRLEDNLKVVLQENQLLDPASLHEDSDEPSSEPTDEEKMYGERLEGGSTYTYEPKDEEDSDEP